MRIVVDARICFKNSKAAEFSATMALA